jgi:kinesin family protein C2/C3
LYAYARHHGRYRKEMTLRKKLHNELVDLKGNIRVFARIRPIIKEDGDGPDTKVTIKNDPRDNELCVYTDPKNHKDTT